MSEDARAMGVTITLAGPTGMITLRGDLATVSPACTALIGAAMPGVCKMTQGPGGSIVWMSPDEVLLVLPPAAVTPALAQIAETLEGQHHLAVDVSDARAMFSLAGPDARELLGKLTPADLRPAAFGPGTARRSQLGQVAAAFWMTDDATIHVVCFRSVGDYMQDLLRVSADAGSVGHY